jgi:hypothetical protein
MIAELILAPVLEFVFGIVGYQFGRIAISVVSLGAWTCDPFLSVEEQDSARPKAPTYLPILLRTAGDRATDSPRLGGVYRRRQGRVVVSAEVTVLVGLLVFIGIGVGLGYGWWLARQPTVAPSRVPAEVIITNRPSMSSGR